MTRGAIHSHPNTDPGLVDSNSLGADMKTLHAATVAAITALFTLSAASAAPLDPNAFASIGTLGGGAITLDTDALTFNGGAGGVLVPQGGAPLGPKSGGPPDIAVFTFGGGSVLGDVTITGSRAAAILFRGAGTVTGLIDVSGASAAPGATGATGALGGGSGDQGGPFTAGPHDGFGPGGGTAGSTSAPISGAGPGSGGGFGTTGGSAGAGVTFVPAGISYGDIVAELTGGSGGGGGGGYNGGIGGGGAGGGALEIGALTDLSLTGATLRSDGGDGSHLQVGGGGGSGGGILLHGFNVVIDAASVITANGGDGGWGGSFFTPAGSCGGAGRIAVISNTGGTQTVDGTVQAEAGASGHGVTCGFAANPLFLTDPEIGEPSTVAMSAPATTAILGLGALALARRRGK